MSLAALLAATRTNIARIPPLYWLALLVALALTNAIDFSFAGGARANPSWLVLGIVLRIVVVYWLLAATLRLLTASPRPRWAVGAGWLRYVGLNLAVLALGAALAAGVRAMFPDASLWAALLAGSIAALVGLRIAPLIVDAAYGATFRPIQAWRRLSGGFGAAAAAWALTVLPITVVHFWLTAEGARGGHAGTTLYTLAAVDGVVSTLLAGVLLSLQAAIWSATRAEP